MSGGIAYVLDSDGTFATRCNREFVELESPGGEAEELHALLRRHAAATGSATAARLLADWPASLPTFIQVMPVDYKRALRAAADALAVVAAPASLAQVAHG
jgi:glutamate synthase domain-containing protein 3